MLKTQQRALKKIQVRNILLDSKLNSLHLTDHNLL